VITYYELNRDMLDQLLNKVLNQKINKDFIKLDNKEVIIYGAGDLGELALQLLSPIGIKPLCVVDKNPNKTNRTILDVEIISPSAIKTSQKETALFVVCIVKRPFCEIKNYLMDLGCKNITHFYDFSNEFFPEVNITNGWKYEDFNESDKISIQKVYDKLINDTSRAYYLMTLYWRICHTEIFFDNVIINTDNKFFPDFIRQILTKEEVFVDCGAYTGNTIQKFLSNTNNNFDKIIAYEPSKMNFRELEKFIEKLDEKLTHKVILHNYGIGKLKDKRFFIERGISSKFSLKTEIIKQGVFINSLDEDFKMQRMTFLKLHLEGMELDAIIGGIKSIKKYRPILAITLYHTMDGIYKIVEYLMRNIEDYYYYYCLHMYCGQSSVVYAIPKERKMVN
jgi:FkbM family methyltransferase